MKKKIIESVLRKKFDSFLESIEDKKVAELVRDNTMISGGSIASMLMGLKVNDYDLYFMNKETTLAVAEYYASKFSKNNEIKATVVDTDNLDDHLVEFYRTHGISGKGRIAIYCEATSQNISEVIDDLEGSPGSILSAADEIKSLTGVDLDQPKVESAGSKYRPVFISPNAISLSDKVQLIMRFYGSPEEIHTNYDFVHVTNYWTRKSGLVLNQPALEAILTRELKYVGSKYPLASILRTKKFILRGWTINAGQYLKMIYQVSKLDLDDVAVLGDQLVGVDVAYFIRLINTLKAEQHKAKESGNPFVVDYSYLVDVIDRIFER